MLPAASLTAAVSELLPLLSVIVAAPAAVGLHDGAAHRGGMPSRMVTVAPASATSTVPVMVCAAWLVAPPALVIATTGAVVSSVKLSVAVPVLPKVSVWLATMVCAPSASPRRGERPGAGGVGGHGGGNRTAVDGEVHHGVGKPGAAQRIVRGDVAARGGRSAIGQSFGHRRRRRAQGKDHRARGEDVAGGVADLRDQRIAAVVQRDRDDKAAVGLHHPAADRRGAVEDGDVRAGVRHIDRAGDGLGRLVGGTTSAGDSDHRRRAVFAKISRGALVFGVCTGAGGVEFELLWLFTTVVISGLESAAS